MKRFLFMAAICLLVAAVTFACSICWAMTHVQVSVHGVEAALSLRGNDKDSKRQEISTLEAAKVVRNACLHHANGATIFEADGIYRHEDGQQVSEKTLRVELLMVEECVVRRIVDFLKAALNQESIAVQMQDVASVLW